MVTMDRFEVETVASDIPDIRIRRRRFELGEEGEEKLLQDGSMTIRPRDLMRVLNQAAMLSRSEAGRITLVGDILDDGSEDDKGTVPPESS